MKTSINCLKSILTLSITMAILILTILIMPLQSSAKPYNLLPDYEIKQQVTYQNRENIFQVILSGITSYEAGKIFHELLSKTSGVVEAERHFFRIVPNSPQACVISWEVKVDGIDGFELESRVFRSLKDFIENDASNKYLEQLKEVLPLSSTSRQIIFATNYSDSARVNDDCFIIPGHLPFNPLPGKGFE